MTRSPKLHLAILAISVLLLGGCAAEETRPSQDAGQAPAAPLESAASKGSSLPTESQEAVSGSSRYVTGFDTIPQMIQRSGEVFIGEVVAEDRGPISKVEEATYQTRILSVRVERAFKGSPPNPVVIETMGYILVDGQKERQLADVEGVHLAVGDRAVFAVLNTDDDPDRGIAGEAGVFLLDNGQVVDTPRDKLFVRTVEALSEQELIAQLAAAR